MRAGEISDPISSPVGYYIFLLRDRRLTQAAAGASPGEIEVDLAQILLPVDGEATLDAARGRAAQLRGRLGAAELKAPDSGRLGWLRVGDLPPGFRQTVSTLPVGQVSEPLEGPTGIHLLMVCDRHNPTAESPQRDQIAQQLQRERVDRLARRYLRDLRKDAFVEVRL